MYRTVELFSLYQTVVRQFESAQLFSSYKKKLAGMKLGCLNVWRSVVGLTECVHVLNYVKRSF